MRGGAGRVGHVSEAGAEARFAAEGGGYPPGPRLRDQVRRIEISARVLVEGALSGAYRSAFKGRGIEMDEVRPYQAGDDVRTMDWNVTSRTGRPHVKRFVEERELTVLLVVDRSPSMHFGSREKMKSDVAAELAGILALAAVRGRDRVGAICFGAGPERIVPPRRGSRQVLRLVGEALGGGGLEEGGPGLSAALGHAWRILKKPSVVFVLSDFHDPTFEDAMRRVMLRHDVAAVSIADGGEWELPGLGWVRFQDPETGGAVEVPVFSRRTRDAHRRAVEEAHIRRTATLKKLGAETLAIRADLPYEKEVVRFFKNRAKRARR